MSDESRARRTVEVVQRVSEVLASHQVPSATIGAMALAAHGYLRQTADFDLAIAVDPFTVLKRVVEALQETKLSVTLEYPDQEDALGGVATIRGPDFDDIQLVNFLNPWTGGAANLAREAVAEAKPVREGSPLKVVSLGHLVALKLYAGGTKSYADVTELLRRNPTADRAAIQALCARFGLGDAFAKIAAVSPA